MPPGYGFLLVIDFSLYAASAHMAPGKTREWDVQKVLSECSGKGKGREGEVDDKGTGECVSQGSTIDTEDVGNIY